MFKQLAPIALTLAGLALIPGAPIEAQDIKYTTVSKAEFGGSLGRMMKLSGAGDPITEVTYIKGNRLRTDDDKESSTITDFTDGVFTWLNHETRTFHSMSIADMTAAAQQLAAGYGADSLEEQQVGQEERQVTYDIKLSTDKTGKKEKFHGSQAEQVLITIEIEATEVTEEEDSVLAGTMVVLADLWMSTEFPGYEAMQRIEAEWRENWRANSAGANAGGMDRASQTDPRIGAAMAKLGEELEGLEGIALKSTTHFVLVPPGAKFDRKKALKDADKSLADDAAGAAANEAVTSAGDAVSGMTGGLFGKKKPEEPKPEQSTVVRVKSEVTEVETAMLRDDFFKAPPDYTETKLEGNED
jgi:hypothetical protein